MLYLRLLSLALLMLPAPGMATTYYVSTTGNNSNDGLSTATPWRTIGHAVDTMLAGDATFVRGGTYSTESTIRFRRTGTAVAPIQLLNYPGESPVIDYVNQQVGDTVTILHASGQNVAVGYITIEGFEIKNGYDGIKFYNMHDSIIRHNWIHDNLNQGILGIGGHHNLFDRNRINHNGNFVGCAAGDLDSSGSTVCNKTHGMYMHGDSYIVTDNLIYDNLAVGIQQNGSSSSSYTTARHPSPAFAGANNWIIAGNTTAYHQYGPGILIWGGQSDNIRIENNICYENQTESGSSSGQCIHFTGAGGATGITIQNNHAYASGSGGQNFISGSCCSEGVQYTQSGNVVNVSPPAFVDGGNNALPASPNFRLTASSPVNIALANEFPNTPENVVGAFKTLSTPTGSIKGRTITLTYAGIHTMDIPDATGLSVNCTGSACPGSPTVLSVTRREGTDSLVDVTIDGIAGDACVAANQTWTLTLNGSTTTWTGGDDIGAYPGLSQNVFGFTNLAIANNCDGTGPTPPPAGAEIDYPMDDGTGTTVSDVAGTAQNGTIVGGGTWGVGHTGSGVVLTEQSSQAITVPWGVTGGAINPISQSFTITLAVFLDASKVGLSRTVWGAPLGSSQRLYVSMAGGTWRIGIQTSNDATASDLPVVAGWNYLILQLDKDTPGSGTGTATLCVNGQCSTSPGAQKTYTSYVLDGDLEIGKLPAHTNGPGGTFDDFQLYLNATVSPADLWAAFNQAPPPTTGTFSQDAVQFEAPYLTGVGASPTVLVSPSNVRTVVRGGGVAMAAQVRCAPGTACEETAYRWTYRKVGSPLLDTDPWPQIPNMENQDGIWMWGQSTNSFLNNGVPTTRLTGTCTMTDGVTLLTASQQPSFTLPADGCTVIRALVRLSDSASGCVDIRIEKEGGVPFAGAYTYGRIDIIPPQASGGF